MARFWPNHHSETDPNKFTLLFSELRNAIASMCANPLGKHPHNPV